LAKNARMKQSAKRVSPRQAAATPVAPAKRALPAALARNAKALHEAAVAKHRAAGLQAIALVHARRRDLAASFLDVARALRVLRDDKVFAALGRASFGEVCTLDLDMSLSKATQLLTLTERIDAPLLLEIGQERASALLDLADARPVEDTPARLQTARVKLPSGQVLEVAKASTRQIREAAVALRRARDERSRGRTTTPEEQATLAGLAARVRAVPGLDDAKFALVAMGARRGADVRIRVPLAKLVALAKVLAKAR
jgi:hypothetical protein